MTDHIKATLNKIPPVKGKSVMTLADIVGEPAANDIKNGKNVIFHVTGDTGKS